MKIKARIAQELRIFLKLCRGAELNGHTGIDTKGVTV